MALVKPLDTFSYRGVVYTHTDVVDDAAEVVKKYPTLFAPVGAEAPVERATAAPGEKRAVKRPAKKTAAKAD